MLSVIAVLCLSVQPTAQANGHTGEEGETVDSLEVRMPQIEKTKTEMLAMGDSCSFVFTGDTELEEYDPHAYWLMNRMMQMMRTIQTAEDCWAWMLAMRESIEEYNSRLGRKHGSAEAAMMAIDELISVYGAGNQPEMNTLTYVNMITAHYRTIHEYSLLIEFIKDYNDENDDDIRLRNLYFREFCEWFDINNAANGIMYFYTYGIAHYSALPMDINSTFGSWSKERLAELKTEADICTEYFWKPFRSNAKKTSERKFNRLVEYFKERDAEKTVKELASDWGEEFAQELVNENMDFERIDEMVRYYETAINNWRNVRKEIGLMLPEEKRKSYREITEQVHTRLYNDLKELKKLNL